MTAGKRTHRLRRRYGWTAWLMAAALLLVLTGTPVRTASAAGNGAQPESEAATAMQASLQTAEETAAESTAQAAVQAAVQTTAPMTAQTTAAYRLSFYQKLALGMDVSILIIGDSIGAGAGADESDGQPHLWYRLLSDYLETTYLENSAYGGELTVTNISMNGNSSYAGYVQTRLLNDGMDYDLAIICYGQNDMPEDFSMYYEAIIRAVRSRWPDCSVLPVLESSQLVQAQEGSLYTEKMMDILRLCDHYDIPFADTIAAFYYSGYSYEELTTDAIHPNNLGYELYFDTIKNVIDSNVQRRTGLMQDVLPYNDGVTDFDYFVYYYAADGNINMFDGFVRISDTAYVAAATVSGIAGLDYTYEPGITRPDIYFDGERYESPIVLYDNDFPARFTLTFSESCTVKHLIVVVFDSAEQADGFYGMCFSWGDADE